MGSGRGSGGASALILWGGGALLAETSYEAFSYAIKCVGRATCVWTSWWEVLYLVLTVASVDALLLSEAYACAMGRARQALVVYAAANVALSAAVALTGALIPVSSLSPSSSWSFSWRRRSWRCSS